MYSKPCINFLKSKMFKDYVAEIINNDLFWDRLLSKLKHSTILSDCIDRQIEKRKKLKRLINKKSKKVKNKKRKNRKNKKYKKNKI